MKLVKEQTILLKKTLTLLDGNVILFEYEEEVIRFSPLWRKLFGLILL
jgi:hypothetical protein